MWTVYTKKLQHKTRSRFDCSVCSMGFKCYLKLSSTSMHKPEIAWIRCHLWNAFTCSKNCKQVWGRMLHPVYRFFFFNEPYSSQQQWCGCLSFIRETELQIRGDKKIANFHLKSVPYLLAYRGRKIKIHYIKSKSYRLLFLEHFELETFAVEQFASFLPLCTLPSIQKYHLW